MNHLFPAAGRAPQGGFPEKPGRRSGRRRRAGGRCRHGAPPGAWAACRRGTTGVAVWPGCRAGARERRCGRYGEAREAGVRRRLRTGRGRGPAADQGNMWRPRSVVKGFVAARGRSCKIFIFPSSGCEPRSEKLPKSGRVERCGGRWPPAAHRSRGGLPMAPRGRTCRAWPDARSRPDRHPVRAAPWHAVACGPALVLGPRDRLPRAIPEGREPCTRSSRLTGPLPSRRSAPRDDDR